MNSAVPSGSYDQGFASIVEILGWREVALYYTQQFDEFLVYPGNSSVGIGTRSDLAIVTRELGWVDNHDLLMDADGNIGYARAEYEARFMLRLWGILPFPRLVELLQLGLTESMVEAHVEHGIDIDILLAL